MTHLSYTKGFPGIADVFLRDPRLYAPLLQFISDVMTRESELTVAEREMIAAHVSRRNGCGFCVGVHRATLASLGIEAKLIKALEEGSESAAFPPRFRAMLRFATKLTETPERVEKADVDDLLKAGWPEQAVEDAINVIALFAYVNRLVDALGIAGEDSYFRQIGQTLARRGYAPLLETALERAG